jgi:hypothetical protein
MSECVIILLFVEAKHATAGQTSVVVILAICVWEILGSSLGQDISHHG